MPEPGEGLTRFLVKVAGLRLGLLRDIFPTPLNRLFTNQGGKIRPKEYKMQEIHQLRFLRKLKGKSGSYHLRGSVLSLKILHSC
jgi:hypothetical protein